MPRLPLLPLAAAAYALVGGACQGPAAREREAQERAQQLLARWFPEARQPVDRASLLAALGSQAPVELPADTPLEETVRDEVQAALARADYQRARDLLVELLGPRELDLCERVLDSGDPQRALALLDRCARTNPESTRLFALRARARYLVGIQLGADGRELVQASLEDGLRSARASGGAQAWTQASLSAFWLGEAGAAREHSDRAVELAAARADGAAERARAQASVAELRMLEQGGAAPAELAAASARTRRALEEFLGFAPADLWTWQQLTALLERDELPGRAQAATLRALEFAPADPLLHERCARLALALGGRARLFSDYAGFSARHPEVALGAWYPAVQHYEAGCELVAAQRDGRAEFEAAEALFARAVELDPAIEASGRDYRAAARVGTAWSLLGAGQLEASEAAFHSAEEFVPGTLQRALPAGLASGLDGLEQLGSRWEQKAPERAAAVFEELHRLAPASAKSAFRAGRSASELALALAERGRAACKRGARAEAEGLFARAREGMERAYLAYRDASALLPDDARLLNECALILVYHLQRDPDEAERLLRRALELGEKQLPDLSRAAAEEGLEADEKSRRQLAQQELVSAVGDARQNLGVLQLTLRGDAKAAIELLESSRGMGPDPRPEVFGPGQYLDQARAALAGTLDPRVSDATRWPEPCKDK